MVNRRRWLLLLAIGGVLALLVAAGFWQHLRLKRAVRQYHTALAAQSHKLTITELTPRTTRQATDAGTRLWSAMTQMSGLPVQIQPSYLRLAAPGRAIVTWREDPLRGDKRTNLWPLLAASVEAHREAMRAACAALEGDIVQFDRNYAQGFRMLLPHLAHLKKTVHLFGAACLVALHSNDTAVAWESLQCAVQLPRSYRPEPTLISHLVHVATAAVAWGITWEALQHESWTDEQLARLQERWAAIDFLAVEDTLAMEYAFLRQALDEFRSSQQEWIQAVSDSTGTWSGSVFDDLLGESSDRVAQWGRDFLGYWPWRWWDSYEEELFGARASRAAIGACEILRSKRSYRASGLEAAMKELGAAYPYASSRFVLLSWHEGLAERFLARMAAAQTQREMMLAGIALHRYRLRQGQWPTNLAQLTPALLPALPVDYMDGQPLRYRRPSTDEFLLYSVGKDLEDNGGSSFSESKRPNVWHGQDWVWPQPASRQEITAFREKRVPE